VFARIWEEWIELNRGDEGGVQRHVLSRRDRGERRWALATAVKIAGTNLGTTVTFGGVRAGSRISLAIDAPGRMEDQA
jgi:hypothetical protein